MSAHLNSQECQIDNSYCKFGSEAILKLLEGFEEQIEGVIKNDDIEFVHKTRVSSRRLRAALPLFRFCFPGKAFKIWRREIKKVTQLLANARDLDVQIAFIEQYMEKSRSATEKAGVGVLLKDHKTRRNRTQSSVANGLEKLKASGILPEIRFLCKQIVEEQSKAIFDPSKVMEKAHWHISFRLDDFLAMEEYVHLENEILKHHEMRILAKKLRYTMEIFAPLYEKKLAKEIETIKNYQDLLGEMHDSDVWIAYIPKFIEKTKAKRKMSKIGSAAKTEQALLNFQTYVKQRRKQRYSQFVQQWEENKKENFFVQLKETTKVGLIMAEEKAKKVITNPQVKIACLADIHANIHALEKVIQDAEERGVDLFLNAGDTIGFGPCPNEVVELICDKNFLSILGNYDAEVIEGQVKAKGEKKVALKFARKALSKSCEDYLVSLPRERRLEVTGKKLLMTHGSPESIEEHIYHDTPNERLKTLADAANADIIIVGHSHEQFWIQTNGISFVNPGSVGRPGDENPQTAYAILTFSPFKVELIRLDYDIFAAADALRKKGLPQSFAQMLLRGVSLDTVTEEDIGKKDLLIQDCKGIAENSWKFGNKYWQDNSHSSQVSRLALQFFDGLISVHKLGDRERCWLECAAILHDVGLSQGTARHHKESAKIILNDTQLPFTSQERQIVASIARYHRKGLPKQKHFNLAALDREIIRKIKVLASLLRVADGLDYTHQSKVKSLRFKVGTRRIIAECVAESESVLEGQAFNKKKDLFEDTFAKKLVLVWKQ